MFIFGRTAVRPYETILRNGCACRGKVERRQEATPLAIISIDCDGNFSTFSPELLGLPGARYGGFALGNVARDDFRAQSGNVAEQRKTKDAKEFHRRVHRMSWRTSSSRKARV